MLERTSKKIVVPPGGIETVEDSPQFQTFYDLNIVATPLGDFTGQVDFYLGDMLVHSVAFANERKMAVFAPGPPSAPEIFPATLKGALEEESGEDGSELRAKAKITNSGMIPVVVKVHFMRKLK